MYKYVEKSERDTLVKYCSELIHKVQISMRDYFTFDVRLIGSGEKRLITRNGSSGDFDLDYNLILQKDKTGLTSNPKQIKDLFLNAFNKHSREYGFNSSNNSTSVISGKKIEKNKLIFSFDIAILIEGNNGNYYKLIFDKPSNRYFWNEIKKSKNYQSKYKKLKQDGKFVAFKNRYLINKNRHLSRKSNVGSFPVFLETLNEF